MSARKRKQRLKRAECATMAFLGKFLPHLAAAGDVRRYTRHFYK